MDRSALNSVCIYTINKLYEWGNYTYIECNWGPIHFIIIVKRFL